MNAFMLTLVGIVLIASLSVSETIKSSGTTNLDTSSFRDYQARMTILRASK